MISQTSHRFWSYMVALCFCICLYPNPSYSEPAGYVQEWLPFPELKGESIDPRNPLITMPKRGEILVTFFVASWCIPCQNLMDDMRKLEREFVDMPVKFIYVFSHDTLRDAQAFAKAHTVKNGVLANTAVLKNFHNPELPSVFVSERRGLLQTRILGLDKSKLKNLADEIALQLAF